jgi:hypothetical protein
VTRRNQFFRGVDRIEQSINQLRYDRKRPSALTEKDYEDFETAGNIRRSRKVPPQTMGAVRAHLKRANFVRYMRLKHDLKWARRQLVKMGRNPSEVWSVFDA